MPMLLRACGYYAVTGFTIALGHVCTSDPFYIYDAEDVQVVPKMRSAGSECQELVDRILDKQPDILAPQILAASKCRATRAENAKWVVVPIPLWYTDRLKWFEGAPPACNLKTWKTWISNAWQAVIDSPVFRRHEGRDHIAFSLNYAINVWAFAEEGEALPSRFVPKLGQITIANDFAGRLGGDECQRLTGIGFRNACTDNPSSAYRSRYPNSGFIGQRFEWWRCSVILPWQAHQALALEEETFEQWMRRRPNTIGYDFAMRKYGWNAPRAAPLKIKSLSLSSVDISGERSQTDHIAMLQSSKFCIVTRGDLPGSRKFYEVIANMCIPVLVSDGWELMAKPFPLVLPGVDKFCVRIPESLLKEFPAVVRFLYQFSDVEMRSMFEHLRDARRELDWNVDPLRVAENVVTTVSHQCGCRGCADSFPRDDL